MEFSAETFNKYALGAVAIISMIVGPWVQWKIAKRQAKLQEDVAARQAALQEAIARRQVADSVASKRLAWIGELRVDLASLIRLFTSYFESHYMLLNHAKTYEEVWTHGLTMKDHLMQSATLATLIELRLSGEDPTHQGLLKKINLLRAFVQKVELKEITPDQMSTWHTLRTGVLAEGRQLLEGEWERVKRGEV